jgi:dTDP-4-dehydrorhamnose 3,5-epimerase
MRRPDTSRREDPVIAPFDFVKDSPTSTLIHAQAALDPGQELIAGVTLTSLSAGRDGRGELNELLTTRDGPVDPILHVYQVTAQPGSVRAWVFHSRQDDQLAFTAGEFRVALYDIRPDSPTRGLLNLFDLGAARRALLRIPAFVAHGVQNRGAAPASFVNMPTRAYDPRDPDKWRVAADDPRIPYRF